MRSLFVVLTLVMSIYQCAWPQSMPGGCIFPIIGKSVTNILNNTNDPHNDGWKTSGNEFGNYCATCDPGYPGLHPGEDWNMVCNTPGDEYCDEGAPVYAIADGKVLYAQLVSTGLKYGVIIEHDLSQAIDVSPFIYPGTTFPVGYSPLRSKIRSGYLHLKNLTVSPNMSVKKGDKIGEITNSGNGPHLHLEIQWMTNILGFPHYAADAQGLTDRGLLDPTEFLKAQIANNAPAIYTYTDSGYTAYGPVVGGSATNWEYSASPRSDVFNLGETAYAVMKVENVRARHRYRVIVYYREASGTFVEQWRSDTAYNEASATSPWEKSFFFPGVYLNKAGRWGIDAYIDVGNGFVPLDNFGVTANALARYTYDDNAVACTGPIRNIGNWVYSGTSVRTSFRKGDTAYALMRINNITASHKFHVDAYLNGIKKWGWDSGTNNVTGTWDKAYFFPEWYNLPAGNCEMRLYVNFGQGNELVDTVSFSVSTSATPYFVRYARDMTNTYTSYMCKSVTGGASTDWVYMGQNKTTTFRTTDTPTALFVINDVKVRHRFLVEASWRASSSDPWQFKWPYYTSWNEVSATSPWKWSYFWPQLLNRTVGYWKFDIYVETPTAMSGPYPLTFTVTN